MLVDANLLLYAHNAASPHNAVAAAWLTDRLNGSTRMGLPWPSLLAFVRVATHPRASERPISLERAWTQVEEWLIAEVAWTPLPTPRHAEILGDLVRRYDVRGNMVPDAHLAALAIEYGVALCSADTDFARFTEVRWVNPLAERRPRG